MANIYPHSHAEPTYKQKMLTNETYVKCY